MVGAPLTGLSSKLLTWWPTRSLGFLHPTRAHPLHLFCPTLVWRRPHLNNWGNDSHKIEILCANFTRWSPEGEEHITPKGFDIALLQDNKMTIQPFLPTAFELREELYTEKATPDIVVPKKGNFV
jgi:hypothetical protein